MISFLFVKAVRIRILWWVAISFINRGISRKVVKSFFHISNSLSLWMNRFRNIIWFRHSQIGKPQQIFVLFFAFYDKQGKLSINSQSPADRGVTTSTENQVLYLIVDVISPSWVYSAYMQRYLDDNSEYSGSSLLRSLTGLDNGTNFWYADL